MDIFNGEVCTFYDLDNLISEFVAYSSVYYLILIGVCDDNWYEIFVYEWKIALFKKILFNNVE